MVSGRWTWKTGRIVALVTTGAGLALVASGCVAAGSWTLSSSAVSTGPAQPLRAISCPTATTCVAVADSAASAVLTGPGWSFPSTGSAAIDKDVSCATPTSCVAVSAAPGAAERFDGTGWSSISTPSVGSSSFISAVSCPTTGFCMATGGTGGAFAGPLAMTWNGSGWSDAHALGLSGTGTFTDVSCPTATFCMAVGLVSAPGVYVGAAEIWNGTTWSTSALPASEEADKVSCPTPIFCAVGGFTGGADSSAVWRSGVWSAVPLPLPAASSGYTLGDLSCAAASFCLTMTAGNTAPVLIDRWDGTAWNPVSIPADAGWDWVGGLSCPAVDRCAASVSNTGAGNVTTTTVAWWDGTAWNPVSMSGTPSGGAIEAESCAARTDCLAVGDIVQHWDGTAWTQVPDTPRAVDGSVTNAVACLAVSSCVVGGAMPASGGGPTALLFETWNGTTLTPYPDTAIAGDTHQGLVDLTSLSCIGAGFCLALGFTTALGNQPVAYRWDGTVLTQVAAPNGMGAMTRSSLSCVSPSFCEAAGTAGGSATVGTWSRGTWQTTVLGSMTSNGTTTTTPVLTGVSCASSVLCMAVGQTTVTTSTNARSSEQVWISSWNGSSWSTQAQPSFPDNATFHRLAGVSCASGSLCVAVGDGEQPSGSPLFDPASVVYDGSQWLAGPNPTPAPGGSAAFSAVSCLPAWCQATGATPDPGYEPPVSVTAVYVP